jgi:molecular chaperone DnaK (HSP70)
VGREQIECEKAPVDAVAVVPASFGTAECQLLVAAAAKAKVNVKRLIISSTAAALTYSLNSPTATRSASIESRRVILAYDMGARYTSASLVRVDDADLVEVLATAGTRLGGTDFDTAMAEYLAAEFRSRHPNTDLAGCPEAMQRLRDACESAKRHLSSGAEETKNSAGVSRQLRRLQG